MIEDCMAAHNGSHGNGMCVGHVVQQRSTALLELFYRVGRKLAVLIVQF